MIYEGSSLVEYCELNCFFDLPQNLPTKTRYSLYLSQTLIIVFMKLAEIYQLNI